MPSDAQVEVNTELAQRLQDILKDGTDRKFTAGTPRKKRKRKKNKGAPQSAHSNPETEPCSVLGKNSIYAQNGSDYLRAHDGRGVYRNFSHKHLDVIREFAKKVAEFPGGPPQNFDPRAKDAKSLAAGANWPYLWNAHHVIPGDAFTLTEEAQGTSVKWTPSAGPVSAVPSLRGSRR